ncbi:MAG TPA: methionine--tRNA ligase, partial [Acidobacteriaceae bacterium]|nr:methionine--tRNA ligase [Acidobacteriaceae bacterium]
MPDTKPKFYVTTPIYYVNARPHIGHAYTTIVADVVARRRRLLGDDVWFLTGTDEHGQKIERAAKAAGTSPQEFADSVSIQFRNLWDRMGLTYDQYIRTTDEAHKRGVQKLFSTLQANGYIYLNAYTGAYCVSDEAFVDAPVGTPCPDCGRILEEVTEENYFFKLSAFQEKLIDLIVSEELLVEPFARRNEVLSFLRGNVQAEGAQVKTSKTGLTYVEGALKDLSISRSSFNWGVPVPGDPKHVIYVWLDALANYITALGYGSADESNFEKYWPADLHLVGKEIIRFHCVYWPAFLMAAELPLPKKIVAHGWLLFEESKMSKSRGNIVRAETILEAFGSLKPEASKAEQDLFGTDVLRYFLLRE